MAKRKDSGQQVQREGPLVTVSGFMHVAGYANGMRQPSLRFGLHQDAPADDIDFAPADRWIEDTFSGVAIPPPTHCGDPLAERFLDWTRRILESRHQPIVDMPKGRRGNDGHWMIWHPCLSAEACKAAIELTAEVMNAIRATGGAAAFPQAADALLERYSARLKHGHLFGFNPLHFARAAHELGIPWQRFSSRVLQVGIGAASRLLESSMTDRTSTVASMFARDKIRTVGVMRTCGVPVASHHRVASAEDAQAAAAALGYPVVVKPVDADGGEGVTAYLHSPNAVAQAFAKARACSANVMVEKHMDGNDYRFHIVHGSVLGVLERSPGSVTGDGRRSVRELVEAQNHERRSASDDRRHLHEIELDEEAETILADTGRSWDNILAAGEKLRLRGAASISRGGIPRELDLSEVHPDNLALAAKAARVLRLDIAGVDLLLPDVGASWLETGASICEVNSAPSMFTSFHVPTLRLMMHGGNGRIPVVVVLSPSPAERTSAMIHARLNERGLVTGLVNAEGTLLGKARPFAKPSGSFAAATALTRDPALQALVITVTDSDTRRHGWAIDRCDAVVLAGGGGANSPEDAKGFAAYAELSESLAPRSVFVDAADPVCLEVSEQLKWARVRAFGGPGADQGAVGELADAVVDDLLAPRRRA